MSINLKFYLKEFPERLSMISGLVASTLLSQFNSEESIINPEAQGILSNPTDRKNIDDTVQRLKNDPTKNSEKLTLSNKEELVITVN